MLRGSFFSSEKKPSCTSHDLKIIRNNLVGYNLKETCIKRILDAISKLPCQESVLAATKFLTELQPSTTKREEYFTRSPYFSEFFCTIFNLGLFAVAYQQQDLITLFAGTFSALSHAIPSERLHDLDLVGVFLTVLKALKGWEIFIEKPEVLWVGLGAGSLNILDTLVTNRHLKTVGSSIHVIWHLAAAVAIYKFNLAKSEMPGEGKDLDLNNATVFIATLASTAALSAKGFLTPYLASFTKKLNECTQELTKTAVKSSCVIL